MKSYLIILALSLTVSVLPAQELSVTGPDQHLKVQVSLKDGKPVYRVSYKDKTVLEDSPLGLVSNAGDFSQGLTCVEHKEGRIDKSYVQNRIKQSNIRYQANELTCTFANPDKQKIDVIFRVSNNDIAFRYVMPRYGETGSCVIEKEPS